MCVCVCVTTCICVQVLQVQQVYLLHCLKTDTLWGQGAQRGKTAIAAALSRGGVILEMLILNSC